MLSRCYFVMLGFSKYAQLPQFFVQILHEGQYSLFNDTKVMVFQLLATRRFSAEQGASTVYQVFTFFPHFFVNQEILLFRTNGAVDAHGVDTKNLQNIAGCLANCIHGAQQRSLFIQHFASVGAERGGDAQAVIFDKSIAGRVPSSITTCFEGSAQAAGGEAGGVGFALDQFLAGEVHDNTTFSSRRNKAFMLFSSNTGHRLEPMCEVGATMLQSPILHSVGNNVSNFQIQGFALDDCLLVSLVGYSRQTILHNSFVKY